MRFRPILFNTEMVRAILSGSKTQTRRLPSSKVRDRWLEWDEYQCAVAPPGSILETEKGFYESFPPCVKGDILYVRETWKQATGGTAGPGLFDTYLYKADEPQDTTGLMVEGFWHPSIHMPKKAARIFLLVKETRIERLQSISEDDALAEGASGGEYLDEQGNSMGIVWPHEDFSRIWDSTIKAEDIPLYGWDANPYVWVIEFERIEEKDIRAKIGH